MPAGSGAGPRAAETAASPADSSPGRILIRGARTHNLRSIDVEIPHDRLTVITGPSGCGKSSLAIDTLFAEGQRQYVETLSSWARQFIHQLPRADVDSIEGLTPALRVDQHSSQSGPRSTVGTITGIHDFLRLLFARVGQLHCHQCGDPVRQQSPQRMGEWIAGLEEGTRVMLMAPLVRARKGKHHESLERVRKERLVRVRIDGTVHDIESVPELNPRVAHTIEAVADRIVVRPGGQSRIGESLRLALSLGDGVVQVAWQAPSAPDRWQERTLSTRHACSRCGISYPPLEPNSFSFNSPHGACPACSGLGRRELYVERLVFPDSGKPPTHGAVFWKLMKSAQQRRWAALIGPALEAAGTTVRAAVGEWPEGQRHAIWFGREAGGNSLSVALEKLRSTATDPALLESLEACRAVQTCPVCAGARLRPESLAVTVGGLNVAQVSQLGLDRVLDWSNRLEPDGESGAIAGQPLAEIRSRLRFLLEAGLDYLTLERPADTLSGGEFQRVRLAAAIGNGLTSVCFVLDEPSTGLHPRDTDRLLQSLRRLRDEGNTLVVVEHDASLMQAADHLIDMGPGSGRFGGQVVAMGSPGTVASNPDSATGRHLAALDAAAPKEQMQRRPPPPAGPRGSGDPAGWITLVGATGNNLQNVDVRVPLGRWTCVTGVSGSGKSTLVMETLVPALQTRLGAAGLAPLPFRGLKGGEGIRRVALVDQRPAGRNPRGCPATWIGIMGPLRKLFAGTREAKRMGFGPARFSFNSPSGWCPECQGLGRRRISMNFLPDLQVECPACRGSRYNPQSLLCRFRERTIADVLGLDVAGAAAEFSEITAIARPLQVLQEIGLGYLQLGQPASTLSGGECQRLKLSLELCREGQGDTLYVLDEPTTGLHFDDVDRLVRIFRRLIAAGNSLLVIEHHPGLIASADWVIDLGPGAGRDGGRIVAEGTPDELARNPSSVTGPWLWPDVLSGVLTPVDVCGGAKS